MRLLELVHLNWLYPGTGGSSGSFFSRASRWLLSSSTEHPVMFLMDLGRALNSLGPRMDMLEYLAALIFPGILDGTTGIWQSLPCQMRHVDSPKYFSFSARVVEICVHKNQNHLPTRDQLISGECSLPI